MSDSATSGPDSSSRAALPASTNPMRVNAPCQLMVRLVGIRRTYPPRVRSARCDGRFGARRAVLLSIDTATIGRLARLTTRGTELFVVGPDRGLPVEVVTRLHVAVRAQLAQLTEIGGTTLGFDTAAHGLLPCLATGRTELFVVRTQRGLPVEVVTRLHVPVGALLTQLRLVCGALATGVSLAAGLGRGCVVPGEHKLVQRPAAPTEGEHRHRDDESDQ